MYARVRNPIAVPTSFYNSESSCELIKGRKAEEMRLFSGRGEVETTKRPTANMQDKFL